MSRMWVTLSLGLGAAAIGCGGGSAPDVPDAAAGGARAVGLQYSGAIQLVHTAQAQAGARRATGPAGAQAAEVVALSAPIFPDVLALYPGEGASFPTDAAGEAALAHASALTFPFLLQMCAALDPTILAESASGPALTPTELAQNYSKVARCAYDQYTAKPYWIPRLVDDVDICATELGADFRLLAQADVEAFSAEDLQLIEATLSAAAGGDQWGTFYYGLTAYVRATDGTLASADLTPGAAVRISTLAAVDPTVHLERGLSLRCIRRSPL